MDRTQDALEYLAGTLYGDPKTYATGTEQNALDTDPYGHCSAAFWRGLLESVGILALHTRREAFVNPCVGFRAANYWILAKFHAFLMEHVEDWDQGLESLCSRNSYIMRGVRARQVIEMLYHDAWTSRVSARLVADDILRWRR